ncbi:MAG: DUF1385 domain-containing protein [Lachnospiraceae bacterium]|nr:DUF1385 domain-containing protein [Lachnospiraceae bacterium]
MRPSGIGGQAVMEGIMMRNGKDYALAVRMPDGTIHVEKDEYNGVIQNKKLLSLPFIRGVFNFIDSLYLGTKTLMKSSLLVGEEEEEGEEMTEDEKAKSDKLFVTLVVTLSVVFSVGLFILLPTFLSNLLRRVIPSLAVLSVVEGLVRLLIFLTYMILISRMKDIQRTFMYHGAEHKCINCIESGLELNVENVRKSTRLHKRCGTSFLFLVILISIILFLFIRVENVWLRMLTRLLLVPVIAGISYEFIRLAGRSDAPIVNIISKPGLLMQKYLTTKEPDDSMIEVAIAAVEEVFDWRAYLNGEDVGSACPITK